LLLKESEEVAMITTGSCCWAVGFFDDVQLDGTSPAKTAINAANNFVSHMRQTNQHISGRFDQSFHKMKLQKYRITAPNV
jgi:hypothetical protein